MRRTNFNRNLRSHRGIKDCYYHLFQDYCLEELTKIMECVDNKGQEFFYVYYKCEPLDCLRSIVNFGADLKGSDLRKVQRVLPFFLLQFSTQNSNGRRRCRMRGQISASTATDKVKDDPNFNLGISQVLSKQNKEERNACSL
ncbi:hypothetical protein MTR67_028189 [Solanum verrucosum]|uniref:Uncharacterized protein n=1 Tax=Solanum verrucosum TaxID=315347 RepID=A0AAF0RAX6_SOLVR|nr:hypothetical protein MTR67_028189 [Solanum verrucosum]